MPYLDGLLVNYRKFILMMAYIHAGIVTLGCAVRFGSKNEHQTDMCLKDVGHIICSKLVSH